MSEAAMTDLAGIFRQRSLERWLSDWLRDNLRLDDVEIDECAGDVSALFGDVDDEDEDKRRFVVCNVYSLAKDLLLSLAEPAK
jgi:hypothetical protein